MKQCSHCKQQKPLDAFSKNKGRVDGYHHQCKVCRSDYYKANKDVISHKNKQTYLEHRDDILAKVKHRYVQKRNEILVYHLKYRELNKAKINKAIRDWSKQNIGLKLAYNNNRKSSKLQRTPAWLNEGHWFEIECIYTYAAALNSVGLHYHVDHEIPLQGKTVSGLHVPENLQVITAKENMKKGNRYND